MSSGTPIVNKAIIKAAKVRAAEKHYRPIRCYKYVLDITTSDESRYVIYRTISEFFELQMKLIEAFPIETGQLDKQQQTIPLLQSSSILQRDEVRQAVAKRRIELADYLEKLVNCEKRILSFPELQEFFSLSPDDLETDQQSKKKKQGMLQILSNKLFKMKKKKASTTPKFNDAEMDITGPVQFETYIAIADYKASGKGQISLEEGEVVDVIDKNPNGWWYIIAHGIEGWGPASYLDRVSSGQDDESDTDEIPCLKGERYLSIKAYKADMPDELSFPENVVLEILNKVLDGWWIASYDGNVGYVPSMYLRIYKDPYLNSEIQPTAVTNIDIRRTPRRQSIRNRPSKAENRDLEPYRKAADKREQRRIKQTLREKSDLSFGFGSLLEEELGSEARKSLVELMIEQPAIPILPPRRSSINDHKILERLASQADSETLVSQTKHQQLAPKISRNPTILAPPPHPQGNLATKLTQPDCTEYEYQAIEDLPLHPPIEPQRVMPNLTDPATNSDHTSISAGTECKMRYETDTNGNSEDVHVEPFRGLPDHPRGILPDPPRENPTTKLTQQGCADSVYQTIEDLHIHPLVKSQPSVMPNLADTVISIGNPSMSAELECKVLFENDTYESSEEIYVEPSTELPDQPRGVPPPPPRGKLATKLTQEDCSDYVYQTIGDPHLPIEPHLPPPIESQRVVMHNLACSVINPDNTSTSAETECKMLYKNDTNGNDGDIHIEPSTGLPDHATGVPLPPTRVSLATKVTEQDCSNYEYQTIESIHDLHPPIEPQSVVLSNLSNSVINDENTSMSAETECNVLFKSNTNESGGEVQAEPSSGLPDQPRGAPPPPPRGNLATRPAQQDCTDFKHHTMEHVHLHPPIVPHGVVMHNLANGVIGNDNTSTSAETECSMLYENEANGSGGEIYLEPSTGMPDQSRESVDCKNQGKNQARYQLQHQLNEKIAELEKERLNARLAKEKLNSYKKKTEGQIQRLKNDLDFKNEELKYLKDKLAMREADIASMREETAQRAQVLQMAVQNYAQPLSTSLNTSS